MKSALCRIAALVALAHAVHAAPLVTAGKPAEFSIRVVGDGALRVTLKPLDFKADLSSNPALLDRTDAPVLRLQELNEPKEITAGGLSISIKPDPLTLRVSSTEGTLIQELSFQNDGGITFPLDDQPVLGLGEGGPMPGKDWRHDPVQFDRRGRLDTMEPHWQSDAYGSRNPVALLVGTRGWGLWFATPWGKIDLSKPETGKFIPIEAKDPKAMRQTFGNQQLQ
ncbi:MAG: hypothetical protein EOP83_22190, partial [Verrucomicrobiaceae bacterium]